MATIAYSLFSLFTNEKLNQPQPTINIVLNALGKSGSEHIVDSLARGLGYKRMDIYSSYEPSTHLFYTNIVDFFKQPATIAKQHLKAPKFNITLPQPHINLNDLDPFDGCRELDIWTYKKYSNKIVIHIRDPRQSILSLVHYINKHHDNFKKPKEYFSWPLSKQIDWCIDNLLASRVTWITNWLALKELEDKKDNGLEILITTYDELVANELELLHKIIDFYGIPRKNFRHQIKLKEFSLHFRKGDPNEWRKVFSEEQKQRVAKIVPQSLLQRFGWD